MQTPLLACPVPQIPQQGPGPWREFLIQADLWPAAPTSPAAAFGKLSVI